MSAEDIRIGEGARIEPRTKGQYAPTILPNSPHTPIRRVRA